MRLLAILTLSAALYSCSAPYHIKRAKKQQEKAISKGAVFVPTNDTIYETTFTTDTLTINDTTYITLTNTLTNTIFESGEVRYITRWDRRKERQQAQRIYKDSIKIVKLIERQEAKTQRTTVRAKNRNRWWLWLLIGFVVGFFVRQFVKVK